MVCEPGPDKSDQPGASHDRTLQKTGRGSGKHIKKRALDAIKKRDPAHHFHPRRHLMTSSPIVQFELRPSTFGGRRHALRRLRDQHNMSANNLRPPDMS